MHVNHTQQHARIARFLRDVLDPARILDRVALDVEHWAVGGEPVPFSAAREAAYSPFVLGSPWGSAWDTVWFRIRGTVPASWQGSGAIELLVDLGYTDRLPGFQAEGTVYTTDGHIVKGLEPLNRYAPVTTTGEIEYYIEAAANPNIADGFQFRATTLGRKETAGDAPLYVARSFDVVLRDRALSALWWDATTLLDLAQQLPDESVRRARILESLSRVVDVVDASNPRGGVDAARAILAPELVAPAAASAHTAIAVGHAHLDSAWLWPTRETVRKFARTLSNVLDLIDEYEDFRFVASSAQQYAWVEENYPELFARVKRAVAAGRIVPIGGMWVESDATMIGGESMIRQFAQGTRYFANAFGVTSDIVWLPDSFGFSGALPQIFRGVGATGFVTQKLSWGDTNRMPHHTFAWEGIDGTRILTHFPPVDSYMSDLGAADLARAERQFAEKSISSQSIVPFGWGDGGGGPTRDMIEGGRRKSTLEGSPKVVFGTPAEFFETVRHELVDPPVWSGEMYLELHRGVFTTQVRTKQGNRRSEALLHEAELWAATAAVRAGAVYPYAELDTAWQLTLLNQFHDILPGTAIGWVHEEAERAHARVASIAHGIIENSLRVLTGDGDRELVAHPTPRGTRGFSITEPDPCAPVEVTSEPDGGATLCSEQLLVRFDAKGEITSLIDRLQRRELTVPGVPAAALQLFHDRPSQWDAWDIEEHYRRTPIALEDDATVDVVGTTVEVDRVIGGSGASLRWSLSGDGSSLELDMTVDWREDEKLLKIAFPVGLLADRTAAETQFGHVWRSVHTNTSWEAARYESVAHRWVYVEEPGQGLVIANASSYGWDTKRVVVDGRGVGTQLRATLLRAPRFPDPLADRAEQRFRLSLRPVTHVGAAVAEGYRLSRPARPLRGASSVEPLVHVSEGSVVVETLKLADDGSGDLIVRLYESEGRASSATLTVDVPWESARRVDLLERDIEGEAVIRSRAGVPLSVRPFEIVTVRILTAC